MKVSDKLRACAAGGDALEEIGFSGTGFVSKNAYDVFGIESHSNIFLFRSIADAIDAEEKELRDFCEKLNALAEAREEVDLFGQAYIPLPLDADGKPIRIGDVVAEDEDGHTFTVDGFKIWGGEWWVFHDMGIQALASECHHKPAAVEDILREFADEYDSVSGYPPEMNEVLAKFAKRLQIKE